MKLLPILKSAGHHWRSFVILLVPLLLLPLALNPSKVSRNLIPFCVKSRICHSNQIGKSVLKDNPFDFMNESKCGYVVAIMSIYWMTEAVPLPVTSLLPVILFPLLGVLSTEDICVSYLKETTMMFIGGLIVAIAVEHCNLHKRIALKVLLLIGTSPRKLILGFMITTMFLSMWISNTASTAMMAPIATAVLDELRSHESDSNQERRSTSASELNKLSYNETFDGETRRISIVRSTGGRRSPTKEEICYFLGIAYAANIGGTGTMTGTGTNLTFKGLFESIFPDAEGLNFAHWMIFNVPLMLINGLLAWIWLQILFLGLFRKEKRLKSSPEQSKVIRELIDRNYKDLGPMTYHEGNVLALFLLVVFLWFFRKPEFIPGWSDIYDDVVIDDATAAMIVVFLLFVFPANLDFLKGGGVNRKTTPALLNWKIVHEKVPWGLVLLLGGGFAMAAASKASGLSRYLGRQLVSLEVLPPIAILIIICVATTFLTEVSSNAAVANILLPVLAEMSTAIRIHPLYLMLPATLSCSYAFMLPVATPSNAIVVASSNIRTPDMMKAGIGMNLICCASLILCFSTFGASLYELDKFPEFAQNYLNAHNETM